MKQHIRIAYKKIVERGIKMYEITDVSALEYDELPKKYFDDEPRVYLTEDHTLQTVGLDGFCYINVDVGCRLTEEEFCKIQEICEKSAERLRKINMEIKESTKCWYGSGEYIY